MSSLRHLYSSRVEVYRNSGSFSAKGVPTYQFRKLDTMLDYYLDVPGELMCRIDLNWIAPGLTQAPAAEAGVAPSRMGTLFFDPYELPDNDFITAGDKIFCVDGPVVGVFELRVIPRPALRLSSISHMEVEVVEVDKKLLGLFPRETVL